MVKAQQLLLNVNLIDKIANKFMLRSVGAWSRDESVTVFRKGLLRPRTDTRKTRELVTDSPNYSHGRFVFFFFFSFGGPSGTTFGTHGSSESSAD